MGIRRVPPILTTTLICALGLATANDVANGDVKGEYFNSSIGWWDGAPVVTRVDPEINFAWGDGAPAPGIDPDFFSVRWTGDLAIPSTDTYIFIVQTDDSVLLRIGDQTILGECWPPQTSYYQGTSRYWPQTTHHQGALDLVGGQSYAIELIYSTGKGGAGVQLWWASSTQPQQIVPAGALHLPLAARTPFPAHGATEIPRDATLQWQAGWKAIYHDIYFGDEPNALAGATPTTTGIYRGRQESGTDMFSPGPLEWGKTYYWRIDEVNEAEPSSPWKGPVWRFTTADFLLIDDFESYTDDIAKNQAIFQTWIDGWDNGTGSTVGYTMTDVLPVVHGGRDSMPFEYNNTRPPHCSEAYRAWSEPQNWTVHGVTDLSLWIMGRPPAFLLQPNGHVTLGVPDSFSAWGGSAVLRFGYKELTGDGEIVAQIEDMRGEGIVAEAGIMMRETLEPGSRYAALGVTAKQTVSLARCLAANGSSVRDEQPGVAAPHWLKLRRRGAALTAQHSPDGVIWKEVRDANDQPVAVNMGLPPTVCLGLYVTTTAGMLRGNATAEFSDITFSGSISAPWQVNDDIRPGNAPDDFYVALEDAAGRIAVAVHPDAGVVNALNWTQWRIPLSRFAADGVDPRSIKRMYVGVGDRNNPLPDGSGLFWIDDIRVVRPTSP